MSNVNERVLKVVSEHLGVPLEDLTPAASFVDDLGADSLDTVELVMALEEEFETELNLSKTWGRRTKPFGAKSSANRPHADGNSRLRFGIEDPYGFIDGLGNEENRAIGTKKRLNHSEQKALSILGATDTMTKDEIRKLYKVLIKDLHPDTNDGKRDDEERMTEVVWAWDQIRNSKRFHG